MITLIVPSKWIIFLIEIVILHKIPTALTKQACHAITQGPCPEDTCCNQSKCDVMDQEFNCNENSNCPACGKDIL